MSLRPKRVEKPLPGDYCVVQISDPLIRIWDSIALHWHFDHAAIYVGNNHVVEAIGPDVQEDPCFIYKPREVRWYGIRGDGTERKRADVARYARSHIGQPYDFAAWFCIPAHVIFHLPVPPQFAADPLACCSPLVAKAYRAAGLDLFPGKSILNFVSPDELAF